jgi:hypothetical protein
MLGHLSCVKDHLLEDGTRIHARGAHGLPLLYFPVIYAHLEVANYLLQQGADVNSSSPSGITPLHATSLVQPKMAAWLSTMVRPNPLTMVKPLAMAETNPSELEILRSRGGLE